MDSYAGCLDECYLSYERHSVGVKLRLSRDTQKDPTCGFVTRIYFVLVHVYGERPWFDPNLWSQ
jgi:hypothetical protein